MAINFPDSPSNGDTHTAGGKTFTYDSAVGAWSPSSTGATTFIGLTDTPSSFGTASQIPAINSGANALEFIALPSSVTVYATVDLLPLSGNSAGDQALVTATNRLYIWNGSGWYNIALINTSPTISGVASSYTLASDGTDTVITITATDPEGLPITYSIASDTSGNIATVTQGTGANTNVFTITPSTDSGNAGTFSLTFRASDGVNIATAPASFTLQFNVQNQNYTTALITSTGSNGATNGTFVDSSSASKTITNLNASQTNFSPFRHGGYSAFFDTTAHYITVPYSSTLDFGSNDFTIEWWMHPTTTAGDQNIFSMSNNLGIYGPLWVRYNGGVLKAWATTANGTFNIFNSTTISGSIPANEWTHVAITRTSTGVWTTYLNGVSSYTSTAAGSLYVNSNNTEIGGSSTANFDFRGYIADFRMVNGTVVYTSDFTPPEERLEAITNTSLLWGHTYRITDGSTNAHDLTVTGTVSAEPFAPYDVGEYTVGDHGGSYSLVSRSGVTGPSIDVASDPDFAFGTDPFTIEFWYYPNQAGQQWDQLIATTGNDGIFFANRSGYLDWTNNQDQAALIRSPWPAVGQWSHIVLTQDSTTRAVFINGVRTGTASTAHSWAQGQFRVAYGAGRGNFSNIRIVKGTAVYDPSQSTLTVPTAPLTDVTNTKLLLKGENGGIIDKAQVAKEIYLVGNVSSSTTQSKYLPSSMYFDGSGDYITPPASELFAFGTSDFTIEFWAYSSDISGSTQRGFFQTSNVASGLSTSYTSGIIITQGVASSGGLDGGVRANVLGTSIDSVGAVQSINTWHHFAVVRSSGTVTLYIDGTSIGSATIAGSINATNLCVGGYYNTSYLFQGYMSDFRVTKGLARYTANFTPPAAALQG